jgi:hypothetical protein
MGRKRMPDGTFRGHHQATKLSSRTIRARWVESEVQKLKLLGVPTFHAIAQQIGKVGRGEAQPMVEFPSGIVFPPDYSISDVACLRAFRKGLARVPRLKALEMRDLDTDRLEEAILAAQRGLKQGHPVTLQVLPRLIIAKARLNGYLEPQKLELSGRGGGPVEVKQTDEAEIAQMLERLTREEQIEFVRLYNKARGVLVQSGEAKDEGRKADEEKHESDPTVR